MDGHIKNSISLQDKMSPVFRAITRAIDNTLAMMKKVDQESKKESTSKAHQAAERDIRRANSEVNKLNQNLKNSGSRAQESATKIRGMGSATKEASASATGMSFNLVNFAAALYIIRGMVTALSSLATVADEVSGTMSRIHMTNETGAPDEQIYKELVRISIETRTDIADTSAFVSQLLLSGTIEGPDAMYAAMNLARVVNKAMLIGEQNGEANSRALKQFTQAMAAGNLQGDELRTIREQAPFFIDTLAQGLSKIDPALVEIRGGDLKSLGAQGKLTADLMYQAMMIMEEDVNEKFELMAMRFKDLANIAKTIFKSFTMSISGVGGPLDRLIARIKELLDWLQSADAQPFWDGLARGIAFVTDGIIWLMDKLQGVWDFLQANSDILSTSFITLGLIIAAAAIAAFVSWVMAVWPILLVVAAVWAAIYIMQQMGLTTGQVLGAIVGGFAFLAVLLYDTVILALAAVAFLLNEIFVTIEFLIITLEALATVIFIAFEAVLAVLETLMDTAFYAMLAGVKQIAIDIHTAMMGLGKGVLGVLDVIAKGIDLVFGSQLSQSVTGWIGGLDTSVAELKAKLDPLADTAKIDESWKGLEEKLKASGEKLLAVDYVGKLTTAQEESNKRRDIITELAENNIKDPVQAFKDAYDLGKSIDDFEMPTIKITLPPMDTSGEDFTVRGGNLDSVGKIGSDVSIKDEDLKLLRDIAAREFLLNLQQITPVANVSFGDVKETADVNKIWTAIQGMVAEQLATSLVVG